MKKPITYKIKQWPAIIALVGCLFLVFNCDTRESFECHKDNVDCSGDVNTSEEASTLTLESSSPEEGETMQNDSLLFTFSNAIDSSTVSLNSTDTDCSGQIQLSADDFISCLTFKSGPAYSNEDKTLSATYSCPGGSLKVKLTSDIQGAESQKFESETVIEFTCIPE